MSYVRQLAGWYRQSGETSPFSAEAAGEQTDVMRLKQTFKRHAAGLTKAQSLLCQQTRSLLAFTYRDVLPTFWPPIRVV